MGYSYKVKTQDGEIIEGIIDAPDENTAVNILHNKGHIILSIKTVNKDIFQVDVGQFFLKPSIKDVVIFTRQLSTLVDADMPLSEGLRTMAKQVDKPVFRKTITEISESVESGTPLSDSLAKYPKLFSIFYIKLVKSGEITGKLHKSLNYLADYLERSRGINSKIKAALAYPTFVLFALVVVTFIMIIYVLPQLLTIFEEVGLEELPMTTRILIWTINFINKYLYFIALAMLTLIYFGWSYIQTSSGKRWLDKIKISLPILGTVVRNLYLARIAESLSTLIKSGIPILDALKTTSEIVNNNVYRSIITEAEKNVRSGGSISEILNKFEEIPPLFSSMVAIGEKTGKLDFMLEHMSKFYKDESNTVIDSISQLIEPVLVLILGVAVAILVASILLPIYSLVGVG